MKNKKLQAVSYKLSARKGFTLIELLVVISLMSILMLSSTSVFFSYSKSQTFQTGVSDVVARLNEAKSQAISQVKPSVCGTGSLKGYRVSFALAGRNYRLRVFCGSGSNSYIIGDKLLPVNVSFTADSSPYVYFNVGTGTVDSVRTIKITDSKNTKTITVDTVGNISVE